MSLLLQFALDEQTVREGGEREKERERDKKYHFVSAPSCVARCAEEMERQRANE